MNTYSEPESAFTGKRPVKSECAVCDSDSVFVNTREVTAGESLRLPGQDPYLLLWSRDPGGVGRDVL